MAVSGPWSFSFLFTVSDLHFQGVSDVIYAISFLCFQRTKLRATPEAIQNRLQDIEERISERQRILCLPQRFAKSKQLTRREMEIENSLFQGADRHSFLKALYYQGMWSPLTQYVLSLTERFNIRALTVKS